MIDVCLMLNWFLVEKFYLHYAVCDFDSILLHCTNLFIRQSIDREKIFDVYFENPPIEKSCVRHCRHRRNTKNQYRHTFGIPMPISEFFPLQKLAILRVNELQHGHG